jgi:hypothetical protein
MRAMGLLFGVLAASAFYGIRKRLGDANALRSAALLFFLPILYPYYFLIYTDVLSLALVLCALWATLQNRHTLSAMVLTAAVLVRQNNVAWAALLPALVLWPKVRELTTTHSMPRLLRLTAPYAVPVLIFAIYWAWNGTISLSKTVASVHPDLTLHAGNLYYALLLCLALFPVEIGKGAKEFYTMALRRRWLFLIPIVFVAFANVRGSPDNYAGENYFIHNAVVSSIRHHGWARWLFAFSTAFAACGVSRTRFLLPQGWLIYPTAVFYLCSSWLIEGRYAIVPLAIWMALRQSPSDLDEKIRFAMWIATSQFIIWGILGDHFML